MNFYAYSNQYGNGTTDVNGERIGCVVIFASKAERDQFVDDEQPSNGWYCNEIITASEARHEMMREYRREHSAYWYGTPSTNELVSWYEYQR